MKVVEVLLLAVALAIAPAMAAAEPADIAAAVAAEGRSPNAVKLDQSRKPTELLGFLGLEKGTQVIDMADDRTLPVFDEKIRGNSGRFLFRFRKPN